MLITAGAVVIYYKKMGGNQMRKVKSILALMVVLTIIASSFAGCGSNKENAETTSSTTVATQADTANTSVPKEHMEISVGLWDITSSISEAAEDKVYDIIKDKFNITIKPVNLTWDDYPQKVQIWAASSQLPDIFACDIRTQQSYKKWVDQGVIRAVPSDLGKYPNLKELLDQDSAKAYKNTSDGKYYCIPRPAYKNSANYCLEVGIKIRKDWMENVGITKDPENTDEFIALMKAFAEKDPDGNGQKDTIGFTAWNSYWAISNLCISICPEINVPWIQEDGKWIPGAFSKKAIAGIKDLKKIYDAGAMDKDMAILKGTEGEDKFFTGKAGALAHNAYLTNSEKEKWTKTYPDKKYGDSVKIINPWKSSDGNTYRFEANSIWSESYFPANVDDNKMDRILMLYDYMISDEGMQLYHYGIEGTDYTKDGDNIKITRPKDSNGLYVALESIYPINNVFWDLFTWDTEFGFLEDPSIEPSTLKVVKDYYDYSINKCISFKTNYALSFLDIPSKDKMTSAIHDDIMKTIMSNDVEKVWNDIISNYMKNGYEKAIQEINEAAVKAGIQ